MRRVKDKCTSLVHPCQLGVGTPKCAEIAIQGCKRYMNQNADSNWVPVKVDFSNKFNCVRRNKILQNVKKHAPELVNEVILAMEETQQGNPTRPFLF